jgi:AraC-like DNA-binding protein
MKSKFHIPQNPASKSMVHSFWEVNRLNPYEKEFIIPKGVIEIIFNFSDPQHIPIQLNDKVYSLPRCFINGINTAPISLQLPKHQFFFGIQLQPLAVKKIFAVPGSEFLDMTLDLTLLNNSFLSLWHQLEEQDGFEERIAVFLHFMESKNTAWKPQEMLVNDFLCNRKYHELGVMEIARHLCYSPRQLSRKISEATGMNTEEMLLYKKYLHSLHLIHHSEKPLTEIAYDSSFSDQSHFIRSFNRYTKMTPGDYKRNKGQQEGHLFDNVR